jgi:hypothetical protein
MTARTAVIDWSGNYEENCERLAKHLGTSKIRRKLFDTIYGRVSKPRSRKQMRIDAKLRPGDEQQAQNELDHLWRYGLIRREEINGQVKDRSRYVYSKDPNPTFPTGLLILEFCRKKASPINARWAANACSEDLPSFRILVCA